ncbi:DUF3343 domain-containing protein [Halarsenatibacter silvermanii]|uniref:Putative Se/S carrier protein-like domain-containing protein n=1 Tax=Halarsenatibacter silvermanii TaxID=321763 RepID=A0A1G9TG20_9FIRM|nr:DUF3343 domain-containing protein [Halarsenatibacter silvermanii]SDM46552.1 Protein of unknown function [Halarsenatibacter silvermanii]
MVDSEEEYNDFLVTFHATSAAMRCEKICQQSELDAHLRPVPRDISSSCGLALDVNEVALCDLEETLNNSDIGVEALYSCREDEFVELEF